MQDAQRIRVLIAGDSIVAGYPTVSGFRGRLREELPESVVEFVGPHTDAAGLRHGGYPGHAAKSLRAKIDELTADHPDVAILMIGGNAIPDTPAEEVGEDVAAIVDGLIGAGVKVVFVSKIADVCDFHEHVRAYNEQIMIQCMRPQVRAIDIGGAIGAADRGSPYFSDDCHPAQMGYDVMGDAALLQVFGHRSAKARVGAQAAPVEDDGALLQRADAELKTAYPEMTAHMRAAILDACFPITHLGQRGAWAPHGEPSNNVGAIEYRPGRDVAYFLGEGGRRYARYPTLGEGLIAAVEAYHDIISPPPPSRFHPGPKRPALVRVRGSEAEPEGRPFSAANLGVLALAGALFVGTLAIRPSDAPRSR